MLRNVQPFFSFRSAMLFRGAASVSQRTQPFPLRRGLTPIQILSRNRDAKARTKEPPAKSAGIRTAAFTSPWELATKLQVRIAGGRSIEATK